MTKTPEQWRESLTKQLDARTPELQKYERYYRGDHDASLIAPRLRQAFGQRFAAFSSNFMEKVVDSPNDRLNLERFTFTNSDLDDRAWTFWRANRLDTRATIAHAEAAKFGQAYVLVDPFAGTEVAPRITIESPLNCITATDPADPMRRLAGLKRYVDEDGFAHCYVYLPDEVFHWRSTGEVKNGARPTWAEFEALDNPLGAVPLVILRNNPTLNGGRSDLANVIDLQNAINKTIADALVASETAAFPQRYALGLEDPVDDEGNAIPEPGAIEMHQSVFLRFSNPDVKIGQLPAGDIGNYTALLDMLVQHLSAQTDIPAYNLLGSLVNVGADTVAAAESGLSNKVRRKQKAFSETWQEVIRLCFVAQGDIDASGFAADVSWSNPELHTLAQKYDAASKAVATGVPYEFVFASILGMSPDEVARAKAIRNLPDPKVEGKPSPSPLDAEAQ